MPRNPETNFGEGDRAKSTSPQGSKIDFTRTLYKAQEGQGNPSASGATNPSGDRSSSNQVISKELPPALYQVGKEAKEAVNEGQYSRFGAAYANILSELARSQDPERQELWKKYQEQHRAQQPIQDATETDSASSEDVPLKRKRKRQDKGKGRATTEQIGQGQSKDDARFAHRFQQEEDTSHHTSDSESEYEQAEPIEHTQEQDHSSSDYVVPQKHLEALVNAVIASKQPDAPKFNSRTFLQSIGADPTKTTVVIADAHAQLWRNILNKKQVHL